MSESKAAVYRSMVASRKACTLCASVGLTNPAAPGLADLDADEIGPWTRWQSDLDAAVLVVGQDWGDVASFQRQGGVDADSPTNQMLRELLAHAGVSISPPPGAGQKVGVFLTNAVLCLKQGGAQAPVRDEWFTNCGRAFLRSQIELVHPKVVVTLGERAYRTVASAFAFVPQVFRTAVESSALVRLVPETVLVPVYHCGQRILNTHRKRDAQFRDWERVKAILGPVAPAV